MIKKNKEDRTLILSSNGKTETEFRLFNKIFKCLRSPTNINILQISKKSKLNLTEISHKLGMTEANIAYQAKRLIKCGLLEIHTERREDTYHIMKICKPVYDTIVIKLPDRKKITKEEWFTEREVKILNKHRLDMTLLINYPDGTNRKYYAKDLQIWSLKKLSPDRIKGIIENVTMQAYEEYLKNFEKKRSDTE